MIITLVLRDKSRKVACVLNGTEVLYQSNYQQKHAFSHIIQQAVDNNLSEERVKCLTCDKSNYSVKFSTLHHNPCITNPTPTWPTPHYPCMTHCTPAWPTPVWPTPLLYDPPFRTHPPLHDPSHPTPAWPTLPCMTHSTPAWPTPPHWGAPFGRHAVLRLFHLEPLSVHLHLIISIR